MRTFCFALTNQCGHASFDAAAAAACTARGFMHVVARGHKRTTMLGALAAVMSKSSCPF